MVSGLYSFLASVGFTHPLHPAMTHAPMGMIIGMFLFGLLGLKWTDKHFSLTAYYCSIVALITVFPTAFLGFLDWLHLLQGEWYTLIIVKMVLTVILTILLLLSVIYRNKGASPAKLMIFYALCMACAGGLGYSGGDLVYG
ncbi:MAG: DUF2231 domain-containing protein [Desulfopila sp.]|jgi:uncharacterized membrane protein|nr:DUF2231 domain-containing protein [Desulfopila sp.]